MISAKIHIWVAICAIIAAIILAVSSEDNFLVGLSYGLFLLAAINLFEAWQKRHR